MYVFIRSVSVFAMHCACGVTAEMRERYGPCPQRAYPAGRQAVSLVLSSGVHRLPNWKKVRALSMAPQVIFTVSPALTLNAGFSKQALIFPLQVAGGPLDRVVGELWDLAGRAPAMSQLFTSCGVGLRMSYRNPLSFSVLAVR